MKILAITDIKYLVNPVEKLSELITSEHIDVIVLFGGLFNHDTDSKGDIQFNTKRKKKNNSNNSEDPSLLQLNWLLIPVLIVPDADDLNKPKLLKQLQSQDNIWIRYIHNKGTILDSWLFISITQSSTTDIENFEKEIQEYTGLAPDSSVLMYIGDKKINFSSSLSCIFQLKSNSPIDHPFLVIVDSAKDKQATIIDLSKKFISSIPLG